MCQKRCTLRRDIKIIGCVALKEARLDSCIADEVVELSEKGLYYIPEVENHAK